MKIKSAVSLALLAGSVSCSSISYPRHEEPEEAKYALLISGKTEERHIVNMGLIYGSLLTHGFRKEDICVLDGYGIGREFYNVNGAATRENVVSAFQELESRIDSNDSVFVYVSDHGSRRFDDDGVEFATISMHDGSLLDQGTFAALVSKLDYGRGFFLFDQCYGGAFAQELGYGNNIAIAASEPDSVAYSTASGRSFSTYLISVFENNAADNSHDGRISVQEAFDYAYNHFPMVWGGYEFPVIYTELDASLIFLED
jgi:hypothetical protein